MYPMFAWDAAIHPGCALRVSIATKLLDVYRLLMNERLVKLNAASIQDMVC